METLFESSLACTMFRYREDGAPLEEETWCLQWLFQHNVNKDDVSERLHDCIAIAVEDLGAPAFAVKPDHIIIKDVPDINWVAHSYQQLPAFSVGKFFIYGGHYEGDIPGGDTLGLNIEAATAFGSGDHGTTSGCLKATLDLEEQGFVPENGVLDMGTGSGILGIAAYKVWHKPVLAIDNDEEAVRVAALHCDKNDVPISALGMTCTVGDGFNSPALKNIKAFSLVIANILAGPLKDMAADLCSFVEDGGYVILSGITDEQEDDVKSVYVQQGLTAIKTIPEGEWRTLLLTKVAKS